jgi:hypothetical protein
MDLHRWKFSKLEKRHLGESTVEEAVAKLGQIFRENVGLPPYLWQVEQVIPPQPFQKILRKQQKALPVCVYQENYDQAVSHASIQ